MPGTDKFIASVGGTRREWRGLAVAAVLLVFVVVVGYMVVQLFAAYPADSQPADGFRDGAAQPGGDPGANSFRNGANSFRNGAAQPGGDPGADSFRGWSQYRPACSSDWVGGRSDCQGETSGQMPAIEPMRGVTCGLCCGSGGIPPSVL